MRSAALLLVLAACSKGSTDDKALTTGSAAAQRENVAKLPKPDKPLPPLAADPGDATGKIKWGVGFGGLGIDSPRAVAFDSKGDVIVVGYFEGECTFGSLGKKTSHGMNDSYVALIDPSGKPQWVQTWGGKRDDLATSVAVRGDTIVVAGQFLDEIQIGEFHHEAANSDDLYVAAFDLKGEPQWLFTSGGVDSDGANGIAPTPDGGWVIAGSFKGEARFGATDVKSNGREDALLMKIGKDAVIDWVKTYGGIYDDTFRYVAVDPQGSIYVQGVFMDKVSFGGDVLVGAGGKDNDVVLAKYDANGDHIWSKRFGNAFDDVAGGIAVDQAGNVTMTGSFDESITFGDGDEHRSLGKSDVFVARFATDGKLQWARTFGGEREDIGQGIAVDPAGNTVTTGWFEKSVDFGKGGAITSKGNKDAFGLKLDAKGNTIWVETWGDHDHDQGRAIAMDDKGNIAFAGIFRFSLDAVTPTLESVRAEGDRVPKPDTYVLRVDR